MPIIDLQPSFLVRPRLAPTESIRSLLHRLAVQNKLPLSMLGQPGRLGEATQIACELASAADWDRSELIQRAASASACESDQSDTCLRIGTALLGKRCVVGLQRRICPLCLVSTTWTPIDWEIRQNDACHIHQCMLADKCSACGASIAWLSHQHACDQCGLAWSNFEVRPASQLSSTFAKWTHSSVVMALRGIQRDGHSKNNGVRLEKLLLMLEVLRCEVLRQWLSPKLWADFGHVWSIQLLKDSDYRSWLWSEMFLHAAKDPMTLEKALRPTGSVLMISAYFNGFASTAPVPGFILNALKKLGENKLLHRLASRPVFDVRRHGIYGVFQAPEAGLSTPRHRDDKGWDDEDGQQSELERFLEVC